ncbi:hypothetical protein DYB32_001045 [Aphanomyces invadans]|uniref:Uncharacterized protein n=1 Tax=Aphanomyces invadans TaxID=157072 RepID=A0A418B7X7_9STRA|nr:hypothetical protein DYB32_001045 [Aphanomyces invadans]
MAAIQAYMNALEYNYTGKLYFDVSKNRSHKSIYGTAKDIIHDALPIQCLEAVFVAAYLTAGGPEYEGATFNHQIDRIPISFKTLAGGTIFRHIVLAIKYQVDIEDLLTRHALNLNVLNIKTNIHPWDDVAAQLDLWEYSELMSECESFASVDVAPDAAVVSKLPDLLLRVTPEVLHFKQAPLAASPSADENNRPPLRPNDLVEFASANLFLNNVSLVHHLVVYVIVSESLQVLGKSLVAIPGDTQQRKGCAFRLKPGSMTSTAIRLILPAAAADDASTRTAFHVQYVVVEAGTDSPVSVPDAGVLDRATITIPYDWKKH